MSDLDRIENLRKINRFYLNESYHFINDISNKLTTVTFFDREEQLNVNNVSQRKDDLMKSHSNAEETLTFENVSMHKDNYDSWKSRNNSKQVADQLIWNTDANERQFDYIRNTNNYSTKNLTWPSKPQRKSSLKNNSFSKYPSMHNNASSPKSKKVNEDNDCRQNIYNSLLQLHYPDPYNNLEYPCSSNKPLRTCGNIDYYYKQYATEGSFKNSKDFKQRYQPFSDRSKSQRSRSETSLSEEYNESFANDTSHRCNCDLSDIKKFRDDNYFECHSIVEDIVDYEYPHQHCDAILPITVNVDDHNIIRCKHCLLPMKLNFKNDERDDLYDEWKYNKTTLNKNVFKPETVNSFNCNCKHRETDTKIDANIMRENNVKYQSKKKYNTNMYDANPRRQMRLCEIVQFKRGFVKHAVK